MRDRVSIKMEPEAVGDAFACTDASAQATMINAMGKMLKGVCGRDMGMQVCYIAKEIDSHGRQLIFQLMDFIILDEEERKP
ncbi:hypothetical protein KAR91_80770 [Candidatus Pacearchaeota archaeon]|nr:hypothetical protein [Candidatus Pacearchaeota archaeon]